MAYLVNVSRRAERDLAFLYRWINAENSEAALQWYQGLRDAILSLEHYPNRCARTPENPRFRHLLYGKKPHIYRVIYRVLEKQKCVAVLHIRHGKRQKFKRADLLDFR